MESEYTKRFKFDAYDNPKLKHLRKRYHLDEVVAPGKSEFERQVLLLHWVNHRLKKFGEPSSPARGALDVLAAVDEGHSFFCPNISTRLLQRLRCARATHPLAIGQFHCCVDALTEAVQNFREGIRLFRVRYTHRGQRQEPKCRRVLSFLPVPLAL